MPTPKKGERKKHFIKRCIPYLLDEEPSTLTSKKKKGKQSYAICNSIYDRRNKKNENIDIYTDDVLTDVMGFLNLMEPPEFYDAVSLLNKHINNNPDDEHAKDLFKELKGLETYYQPDLDTQEISSFSDYLTEDNFLDDEFEWEDERDTYEQFSTWLYKHDFEFYEGEEDFKEYFYKILSDDSLDSKEKSLKIVNYLEEKWGLYDGWEETFQKLFSIIEKKII